MSASRLSAPRGWRRGLARAMGAFGRLVYGRPLAPADVMAHHAVLASGYAALETAAMASRRVDERLKLLAELKAAAVAQCEWCMDFGSWLAIRSGLSEQQLRDLPTFQSSDAFTGLEKLVLEYATAMSRTPTEVTDELVVRMRRHFDDGQIVELTTLIALENYRARFNSAVGLTPQGFSEGAACVRPEFREESQAPA